MEKKIVPPSARTDPKPGDFDELNAASTGPQGSIHGAQEGNHPSSLHCLKWDVAILSYEGTADIGRFFIGEFAFSRR